LEGGSPAPVTGRPGFAVRKLRPTPILSAMAGDAQALMIFMRSIVAGDAEAVARSLAASPALASSSLRLEGATRLSTQDYFFDEIDDYLFAADAQLAAASA